mmetsp:Transcript_8105/g.14819  ORF Transcript_8105/g.14819 Transcript_8105/m.14819 type:complete len:187 (-) Transcript_8105:514-1074(-)
MEDDNQSSPDMEIKLVSRDGKEFALPYSGAKLSKLVENALDGKGDDADVDERTVQIPKVEEECLSKVVEYLKHYQEEPMEEIKTPLEENTFEGNIKQQWYREFLEGIDDPLLFELVTAANFMEIREFDSVKFAVDPNPFDLSIDRLVQSRLDFCVCFAAFSPHWLTSSSHSNLRVILFPGNPTSEP